jgi:hypothetical protein
MYSAGFSIRCVAGANDLQVRQAANALQAGHVVEEVADRSRRRAKDGVAGEEHALVFQVIANGVDAVAGCVQDMGLHAAVDLDGLAVAQCVDAVFRQLVLEDGLALFVHEDFGLELVAKPLEVGAVVDVVVGDGRKRDFGLFRGREVAL